MNINQVWPEWNEDCVLGEGSFGKVYRAKRVEYGRVFYSAIKVLTVPKNQQEVKFARSQGMNDEEIYNYFRGLVDNLLNEITLMDNLKGAQNIVGIEDYKIIEREGEFGWDIFIRMELLTPFDSFISNPEFSQKDVIRLGVDICTALEVCEQNYIVHRDIKPDNIFISRFGEYKLGDFGIARKLEATQANLSRKGTLNYMAPEVYKSEEYGSSVDIYSLGLVLYTLLNNNRIAFLPPYPQPISYKDNEEALSKRLSGEPLVPPCNAGVSLGNVILRACAYSPQERYQSASEFKNALIAEWNMLVQSGDNGEIKSDAMLFSSNMDQSLLNTTNDMTANARLVIDEYAQETTVLNGTGVNTFYQPVAETPVVGPQFQQNSFDGNMSVAVPVYSMTSKSSKICRIIAWPLAIATCVFAFILLFKDGNSLNERMVGISLLGIGMITLIADRNKKAIGICVAELSLAYVFDGLSVLLGGLQQSIPISAVVSILSGLLFLFGGITIIFQKEVRFGGSLCVYSFAIEWIFNIYSIINKNFSVEIWHIFFSITALAVFIWSYGYKSNEEVNGVKKILHIITYAFVGLVTIRTVTFIAATVSAII